MILDRRLPPAVTLGPRSSTLACSALSSGTNAVTAEAADRAEPGSMVFAPASSAARGGEPGSIAQREPSIRKPGQCQRARTAGPDVPCQPDVIVRGVPNGGYIACQQCARKLPRVTREWWLLTPRCRSGARCMRCPELRTRLTNKPARYLWPQPPHPRSQPADGPPRAGTR
jgi:hypothetical protein